MTARVDHRRWARQPWTGTHQRWGNERGDVVAEFSAEAERIKPRATWAELRLPEDKMRVLRDLCREARDVRTAHSAEGVVGDATRGRGVTAVFMGERET